MWYLVLELSSKSRRSSLAGAYAPTWVDVEDEASALNVATAIFEQDGWKVVRVEESYAITRETQSDKGRIHFERAVVEGFACVMNAWEREKNAR